MDISFNNDKQNNTIGIVISVFIHALILLLCWFYVMNDKPNPPLPKNGALRLGFDNTGLGNSYEELAPSTPTQEISSEVVEEVKAVNETVDAPITSNNANAPIINSEKVKPTKPKQKNNTKPNPQASYNTSGNGTGTESGGNTTGTGVLGNPNGTYTNNPGNGGVGLDMAGWKWDAIPLPDKKATEAGKVVVEIWIDEKGEILNAEVIETTVNASYTRDIKMKVYETTFIKTDGENPPSKTKGRITYIIKAK